MPQPPEFDGNATLAVLARHQVACVVIGNYAGLLHGVDLATEDVDITPAASAENFERLAAALAELDAAIRPSVPHRRPAARHRPDLEPHHALRQSRHHHPAERHRRLRGPPPQRRPPADRRRLADRRGLAEGHHPQQDRRWPREGPRHPPPASSSARTPPVGHAAVFSSRIMARSETWSLAQDGVSATSPCSAQRIDGSRAVTNASNAITSGWRQVPSVNSTAWQARPHRGHGNREPPRKPRRRSTRRRSKSKWLLTTRHGGSSCNASSKSCFMLRTGTPSVNDRAWYPPDIGEPGAKQTHVRRCRRARYCPLCKKALEIPHIARGCYAESGTFVSGNLGRWQRFVRDVWQAVSRLSIRL